jgi:hypothetical protein
VTLLGGLWVASIFTLLTPATSFWPFCTIRLFTGLGLGKTADVTIISVDNVP